MLNISLRDSIRPQNYWLLFYYVHTMQPVATDRPPVGVASRYSLMLLRAIIHLANDSIL